MTIGVVAFLVPAMVFDLAGTGMAVFIHEGSTLTVVEKVLRLLSFGEL